MDATIVIKKKKAKGHAAHHGGSWKVAYADFVTAMMAFFMVMWIIGLSDQSRKEIASYFKDPFGVIKRSPHGEKIFSVGSVPTTRAGLVQERASPEKLDETKLKEIKAKVAAGISKSPDLTALSKFVDMQVTAEGLRIEFLEGKGSVFFESGSSVIRPEARALLAKIAPVIISTHRSIVVEGHTDAQPYAGTGYTNLDLSQDRAKSLYHAMMDDGMPIDRVSSVRGCGSSELRDPKHPLAFSNRRVSILLPLRANGPTSDGLPNDALKHEIQGAFKKDLAIAP